MENTIAKCQCSGCGKFFVGTSYFDMHRKGLERCFTDAEMREKGMDTEKKNVRIVVNGNITYQEHDVWFDAVGREKFTARFKDTQEG